MKYFIFLFSFLLFIGCGGSSNTPISDLSDDTTLSIQTDKEINTTLNTDVHIRATIINEDDNDIVTSIEWKECDKILSNEIEFDYIPSSLGIHTLNLSVLTENGKKASAKYIVNVLGDINSSLDLLDTGTGCYQLELSTNENITYSYNYKEHNVTKELKKGESIVLDEFIDDCSFQITITNENGLQETLNVTI